MKKMVEFAGINWYPIDHHSQTIIQILKHTLAIHGIYIQQNFNIFSKSLYEKAAESGTRVLLSGFGGDELVSARISNPWNQYIDEGQWKVIFDEIFHNGIGLKTIIKPALLAARYFKSKLFNGKFTSGAFTPELLDRRFANLPLNREFASKNNLRQRLGDNYSRLKQKTMTQRQIDRIMMDHLPQRLEYCYTAAAQYGIEYRYPLLDVDLVETALAFPPWVKQHHGVNRYLFREAMKGLVPEEIRLRNDKSGSTIPQTLFSLVNEKEEILNVFSKASESAFLKDIFDFPKFPVWYDKLAKRDPADMNYMMPGAFYDYLMILLYYGE
jgi:asparagine synthase (glutamine-hydrolysing)